MTETHVHSGDEPVENKDISPVGSPGTRPEILALISMLAGPLVSGPMAGSILRASGHIKRGYLFTLFGTITGLLFYLFLFYWPVKWYWASLILLAVHLGWSIITFVVMRRHHVRSPESYHFSYEPGRKRSETYILAGIIGGVIISVMLGTAAVIFYLLGTDRLFNTLMPVASENYQAIFLLMISMFVLAITGGICGGYLGKVKLKISPAALPGYALVLIWISLSWLFALQLFIGLPGYLAGQASGVEGSAMMFPFVTGNMLIGTWWTPFLFIYVAQAARLRTKLARLALIPAIHFSAAIALVIFIGYPSKIYHAAGRYLENHAFIGYALRSYQQGLLMDPADRSTSYLQYRMALLFHKMGDDARAVEGFRKVVSKYTFDEDLVSKSGRFLDKLTHAESTGNRVVLPGVETRTAYKGAYCVPNSMALVFHFWGDRTDALAIGRQITGLGSGTTVVDQAWYARQHNFRHRFLPLASIDDIKACIDAGFPVMVYVPAHVFVIVGYDERLETLVTYDVATRDIWVDYIQSDFIKSWKKQSNTLVLTYPESEEERIPESIAQRLSTMSDEYLHYHLHHMSALSGGVRKNHLLKAVGEGDENFLPLSILYNNYPGLRPLIAQKYDVGRATRSISQYFGEDFDEGTHLWGQYHDEERPDADPIFQTALWYLIATEQPAEAKALISHVAEHGVVSDDTRNMEGMIDLALGDMQGGMNILNESSDQDSTFYLALANLKTNNRDAAIKQLIETIRGCICHYRRSPLGPQGTTIRDGDEMSPWMRATRGRNSFNDETRPMGLDPLGYPVTAIANEILLHEDEFGDSGKDLEKIWFRWLHNDPFDVAIADKLSTLYADRLGKLDPEKEKEQRRNLERKRLFAAAKAERYRLENFFPERNDM